MRQQELYEDEMTDFLFRRQVFKNHLAEPGTTIDEAITLLDAIHRCNLGIKFIEMTRDAHNA